MVDTGYQPVFCFNIKRAAFPAGNSAYVCTGFLSSRHDGFDHIAGLETKEPLLSCQIASWEAGRIDVGAPMISSADCADNLDAIRFEIQLLRSRCAYAASVVVMLFC